MAELATGSEDAAWRITELYTPHVLRAVRASLPEVIRPKLDSQDFTQSVWASLLLKRGYLSHIHNSEQLIGLLAAAARHKVLDAYRHYTLTKAHNVRNEVALEAATAKSPGHFAGDDEKGPIGRDPTPSQTASVRERWQRVIEDASARDREILRMRMKGATYLSISQALGMSVATVRRTLDRIICELRK
jgi:RNA polymerase sigma factor (sigma-70 family)